MNNTCITCRLAKWPRFTKHNPPKPKGPGQCEWKLPEIVWPMSMDGRKFNVINDAKPDSIWPDYNGCPAWVQIQPPDTN